MFGRPRLQLGNDYFRGTMSDPLRWFFGEIRQPLAMKLNEKHIDVKGFLNEI